MRDFTIHMEGVDFDETVSGSVDLSALRGGSRGLLDAPCAVEAFQQTESGGLGLVVDWQSGEPSCRADRHVCADADLSARDERPHALERRLRDRICAFFEGARLEHSAARGRPRA